MSYAIGTVFYGITLDTKIQEAVAKHENCDYPTWMLRSSRTTSRCSTPRATDLQATAA